MSIPSSIFPFGSSGGGGLTEYLRETAGSEEITLAKGTYTLTMRGGGGAAGRNGQSMSFSSGASGAGGTSQLQTISFTLNRSRKVIISVGSGGISNGGNGGAGGAVATSGSPGGIGGSGGGGGQPTFLQIGNVFYIAQGGGGGGGGGGRYIMNPDGTITNIAGALGGRGANNESTNNTVGGAGDTSIAVNASRGGTGSNTTYKAGGTGAGAGGGGGGGGPGNSNTGFGGGGGAGAGGDPDAGGGQGGSQGTSYGIAPNATNYKTVASTSTNYLGIASNLGRGGNNLPGSAVYGQNGYNGWIYIKKQ